ncbi:PH domain-containing protein [Mucilaginibacter calamicampi]|uniref:PH domain-containing protein n=1 Tax=Mucilaginibacter calamicampi TaxID=1302352 RepID=A0ABW2YVF4_9SPHI
MQTTKTYNSGIDNWLIAVAGIPFVLVTGLLLYKGDWVGLLVIIPIIAFLVHILTGTKYTINGTTLTVKAGFVVNVSIDINTIKSITETNSVLSAPANSLDRIEIAYNKYDSVVISPKNKAEFISDILSVNDKITVTYRS